MDTGGRATPGTKAENEAGCQGRGMGEGGIIIMSMKSLYFTPHPVLLPLIRGEGTL
jgi:hypothetical protein